MKIKEIRNSKEKTNAKEKPSVFYCRHIQAGVARYEDEMIFINNECLKKMMPTMAGAPVYVSHADVNLEKLQEQADGYVSECFYNEKDGWYWAKFIAVSDEAQESIRKGWSVSNSYLPSKSGNGGAWHNVEYDREILDADYTHLAIVPNPRYEEACIMDSEQFKSYNNELTNRLRELKNNKKESYLTIGGKKMKLWKTKKEAIENADNIVVEFEGKEMQLSEMVNAVAVETKETKQEKCNENDIVEVGDEKMTVNELKNKYSEMMEKKNTDAEAVEEKKKAEEAEEKKKAEEAEEKKNAEEADKKKEEGEKKNAKHFTEMKNAIENGGEKPAPTFESRAVQEKRGAERY